jgi:hypothetical protein
MTEQEWLGCTDPTPMLQFLKRGIAALVDDPPTPTTREAVRQHLLGRISQRRRVLFVIACCRRIWSSLKDDRSRTAVDVAERWADGLATDEELEIARTGVFAGRDAVGVPRKGVDRAVIRTARVAAHAVWEAVGFEFERAVTELAAVEAWTGVSFSEAEAKANRAALLHDIIGNPYRLLRPGMDRPGRHRPGRHHLRRENLRPSPPPRRRPPERRLHRRDHPEPLPPTRCPCAGLLDT